jgi:hypothetical protein
MKKIMMTGLLFMVMIWLVGCTFGGRRCSMVGCRRAAALGSSHCREHQGICCVLKVEGKEEPAEDTEEPSAASADLAFAGER